MIDIASELLTKLREFRLKKGDKFGVEDMDTIINEFVSIFEKHVTENDEHIFQELKHIGSEIQKTKSEIALTLPKDAVTSASSELDMVVKSTEDATNQILDAAEGAQELLGKISDNELRDGLAKHLNNIVEACNFQDLTGQRIKKVTSTLQFIEDSVGHLLTSFAECYSGEDFKNKFDSRPDAHLMNGPQKDADVPSQEDIDKLFDSA